MEKRKNPEKDLRQKSGLFFHIGLLMALMLCVSAFEYQVKEHVVDIPDLEGTDAEDFLPPITEIKPPPPPKPKVIPKIVEKPNDEVEEDLTDDLIIDQDDLFNIPIDPIIQDEPKVEEAPEVFITVEEMPSPDGGYSAFYKFIQKNLRYPAQARRMGVEGKVYVHFVINEKGELDNIEILKGIGAGCDEEVLRLMAKAPNWNPGKQRGVPVKVKQVLPITFKLN